MAIKQYSLKTDGAKQLSPAFRVREFLSRPTSEGGRPKGPPPPPKQREATPPPPCGP